jgi:hypothetical protein
VDRWPVGTALAIEGGAAAVAFHVHLEDDGVMDDAVDGGQGTFASDANSDCVSAWSANSLMT